MYYHLYNGVYICQNGAIMITTGTKIKTLRVLRGLSQAELAELAGITRPQLSETENDIRHDPAQIESITAALGLDSLTAPRLEAAFLVLVAQEVPA